MIRKAPISMIMTEHVVTLNKTDNLEKAEHLFKHYRIRHIPVVDENTIIGMISYTDLLRLSFADLTETYNDEDDVMVSDMLTIDQVMNKNMVTVTSSNSIKEVAEILASREFHALPVVDNNTLVGIITTTDLINYLLKQF